MSGLYSCVHPLIPVCSVQNEKEAGLDEEDPTVSNEKSSGQKQVLG